MEKIDKLLTQKSAFLYLFLIIAISIFFRLYHAEQKAAFHGDELLSFQIVNGTFGREKQDKIFKDKWATGTEYLNYYFTIKKEHLKRI